MINGISNTGVSNYASWAAVSNARNNLQNTVAPAVIPKAQPETPVQPVQGVTKAPQVALDKTDLLRRFDTDPTAMAVRSRIRYADEPKETALNKASQPVRKDQESKSARDVAEDSECETCKSRKYQDGSDDPGVSFKNAAHVAPEQASTAIRGHENEHVTREQAKAAQEDRKVVAQSVTYYNAICPECGRIYMSGGTTRTVTAAADQPQPEGEMLYPLGLGDVA